MLACGNWVNLSSTMGKCAVAVAIADADEGDPTGNETVVQMYAFLHECEAGGCRMFSPAKMEATTQ